jgi:hypothetical protein
MTSENFLEAVLMKGWICAAFASIALGSAVDAQSVAVGNAAPEPVKKEYQDVELRDAFSALSDSYKKAGVPVTESDPMKYVIANPSFAASKKIGNLKMDKVFDCGGDKKNPTAAMADLTLSIRSELRKTDIGVEIVSMLSATGNALEGGSGILTCRSLGALERKLFPEPSKMGPGGRTTITVRKGTLPPG